MLNYTYLNLTAPSSRGVWVLFTHAGAGDDPCFKRERQLGPAGHHNGRLLDLGRRRSREERRTNKETNCRHMVMRAAHARERRL